MTCPSLDEVAKGLSGRFLSFEALMHRCGWDGALRLVAAAALKIRVDGERGSIVCLRAKSLWICDAHVYRTFCLPKPAAVEAVRRALAMAESAGIEPFWIAPLKKRRNTCWAKEDAERLIAILLDGITPANRSRRRRIYRGI
jgi:hypothetical protein